MCESRSGSPKNSPGDWESRSFRSRRPRVRDRAAAPEDTPTNQAASEALVPEVARREMQEDGTGRSARTCPSALPDVTGRDVEAFADSIQNPQWYPYGKVGPFIALAEAFGFAVLGVNECGRFESRRRPRLTHRRSRRADSSDSGH